MEVTPDAVVSERRRAGFNVQSLCKVRCRRAIKQGGNRVRKDTGIQTLRGELLSDSVFDCLFQQLYVIVGIGQHTLRAISGRRMPRKPG